MPFPQIQPSVSSGAQRLGLAPAWPLRGQGKALSKSVTREQRAPNPRGGGDQAPLTRGSEGCEPLPHDLSLLDRQQRSQR